jgi:hypothetical protein
MFATCYLGGPAARKTRPIPELNLRSAVVVNRILLRDVAIEHSEWCHVLFARQAGVDCAVSPSDRVGLHQLFVGKSS